MLVGFCLFLLFGTYRVLLNARLLTPLSQNQSSAVVRLVLKHGFWISILVIVLGFIYAGYQAYHDPTSMQSGSASSNINNKTNHNQNIDTNNGVAVQNNQK